ncbi:MAG: cyclic nucleotide-binding domain-containing protein [Desulfovibrionaceae bacterium]
MNTALKRETFAKGDAILNEGQPVVAACMVVKGSVVVYRTIKNKKVVLAQLGEGQIFGEMGLLSGQHAVATVEALEPTDIAYIDQMLLKASLLKSPKPIQRVVQYLISRLRVTDHMIADSLPAQATGKDRYFQRSPNTFLGLCNVLDLMYRSATGTPLDDGNAAAPAPANRNGGVSWKDFVRTVKSILPVSESEIERVLVRLAKLNIIKVAESKEAYFRKDVLGRAQKSSEHVVDRIIAITDLANFRSIAKNLDKEFRQSQKGSDVVTQEFIDLAECAELAKTTPEMLYKKLANQEIPENLFFMEKTALTEWAQHMGDAFFQKTKRKRLNIDELETVDDVVFVDNPTIQDVFKRLDFRKIAVLFAAAGDDARQKLLANMSKKIASVVQEESTDMEVDEMELADVENAFYDMVRAIKGVAKKA